MNLIDFLKKPRTYKDIKDKFGYTKKTIKKKLKELRSKGIIIESYLDENYVPHFYINRFPNMDNNYQYNIGDGEYVIGLVSDTHIGDKHFDLESLLKAYSIFEREGVSKIFHMGDLITGINVYQGQFNDLNLHTLDEQIDFVIENYPRISGVKTEFILGNHDLKALKQNGIDIGKIIAKERDDMVYLGQVSAKIDYGGVKFELCHYEGSTPYALSYRCQKYLRDIPANKIPDILCLGHMHSIVYAYIQGVHSFECGTFQGPNNYTKKKGLHTDIACWLLKLGIEDGKIKYLKPEILLFE